MHDEDFGNPSSNKRAKVDHGTESALASLPRTQASTDDEVKAEEQTKTTGRKRWRGTFDLRKIRIVSSKYSYGVSWSVKPTKWLKTMSTLWET
jgi:hypothetical protein